MALSGPRSAELGTRREHSRRSSACRRGVGRRPLALPGRAQMRRRTPRRGVTAAATTAVFATGDGPGLMADATTAVVATGWPMTPTRPTRAALSGISGSFDGCADHVVGLDRRDDRLDRDTSVGDQLASRAPRGGCERRGPQVLPDEHTRGAAGLHRRGEM